MRGGTRSSQPAIQAFAKQALIESSVLLQIESATVCRVLAIPARRLCEFPSGLRKKLHPMSGANSSRCPVIAEMLGRGPHLGRKAADEVTGLGLRLLADRPFPVHHADCPQYANDAYAATTPQQADIILGAPQAALSLLYRLMTSHFGGCIVASGQIDKVHSCDPGRVTSLCVRRRCCRSTTRRLRKIAPARPIGSVRRSPPGR